MMRACDVKTPAQALAYITDCNLATLEHMASCKSRKKGEFYRQIKIAQKACDWMEQLGVDPSGTRAEMIVGKVPVSVWIKAYLV
jgi:hypothetical protein